MTSGLRLNWHYNPVADISNPLVCMHKKISLYAAELKIPA